MCFQKNVRIVLYWVHFCTNDRIMNSSGPFRNCTEVHVHRPALQHTMNHEKRMEKASDFRPEQHHDSQKFLSQYTYKEFQMALQGL